MHRRMDVPRRRAGLTLIEVVVVVAVIGIIATLAWPAWSEQVRKTRRLDAVTTLYRVQMEQERHRAIHHRYAEHLTELGWSANEVESAEGHYVLSLAPVADAVASWRALATPRAGTDQARDRCGAFVWGAAGRETPDDPSCWPR